MYTSDYPICSPGWQAFNENCFFFNHDAYLNWEQAVEDCSERNATLASIHSEEEHIFIAGQFLY